MDDDGPRAPSMSYQRIAEDLPEIGEGAARLVERRWPYRVALADHVRRMSTVGGVRWSIDDAHLL
ncbi:hypothetical protein [Actinokineospora globicatena]|uniref:hypothetical protein n=1 Tax=Actinokineospora globicatena TaxID=103729 RepID=UPI0020A2C4AF|nr:hypothetical protein [Actinokineospora globicatena]GLW79617.1 hypothetical protein Aglo01_40980 [Actinokineospora globicatena]GLW85973.1 hypothetical protein Aglo02_36130 [Actinokineospora globicatena]